MTDPLYREIILEHWKNPHNFGVIENPDIDVSDVNLLCGDAVRITVKVKNSSIDKIKFKGQGCAISQAAASILTDTVSAKQVAIVKNSTPEEFLEEIGIELTPARLKCALLPYSTLKKGLV
jgi:nitrogen fixation NifU-like protein